MFDGFMLGDTWPHRVQLPNPVGEGMILMRPRSWAQTQMVSCPCLGTKPRIHLASVGTHAFGHKEPR